MIAVGPDNSSTYKFVAYNATGQVWNGSAFVDWVDANFATYGIAANQAGTSRSYSAGDVAGCTYYQLWLWTGTETTSYPVYDQVIAGPTGTGAFALSVNVGSGSVPIVGASVRITGAQSAPQQTTDVAGNCALSLNSGTVTVNVTAPGYISYQATETVDNVGHWTASGTATLSLALTPVVIPSPVGANQISGYAYTCDANGNVKPAIVVSYQIYSSSGAGNVLGGNVQTAISDNTGLVLITMLKGRTYQVWAVINRKVTVLAPTVGATFPFSDLIGDY